MTQETGIVIAGNKKLGKALLDEGLKANQERLQKRVVSNIQELLTQIERHRLQVKSETATIEHLESRVSAIKNGEFRVDDESGAITFNDPELGKDLSYITKCSQCGYAKIVIAKI